MRSHDSPEAEKESQDPAEDPEYRKPSLNKKFNLEIEDLINEKKKNMRKLLPQERKLNKFAKDQDKESK